MITFRARPDLAVDWTHLTLIGEDEDALARIVATELAKRDWEVFVSEDGEDFEELPV